MIVKKPINYSLLKFASRWAGGAHRRRFHNLLAEINVGTFITCAIIITTIVNCCITIVVVIIIATAHH